MVVEDEGLQSFEAEEESREHNRRRVECGGSAGVGAAGQGYAREDWGARAAETVRGGLGIRYNNSVQIRIKSCNGNAVTAFYT